MRGGPDLNKMGNLFKAKMANYDETDLQHAKEMNVKVSDMIIHEVLPDFA